MGRIVGCIRGAVLAVGALVVLAGPASADPFCDDLWLTRNLIFDRAGYCFSSPRGQALFGANGCSTTDPVLSAEDRRTVDLVLEIEGFAGCRHDTARVQLDVDHLPQRMALIDLPVRGEGESACLGWRGAPLILRSGRAGTAPQTGVIRRGEDILMSYVDVEGWTFILSPDGDARMGWARLPPIGDGACDGYAG